jgi:hypothetical protein
LDLLLKFTESKDKAKTTTEVIEKFMLYHHNKTSAYDLRLLNLLLNWIETHGKEGDL